MVEAALLHQALEDRTAFIASELERLGTSFNYGLKKALSDATETAFELHRVYEERGYVKVSVPYRSLNSDATVNNPRWDHHGEIDSHAEHFRLFNQLPAGHAIHTSNVDLAIALGAVGVYRTFITRGIIAAAGEATLETADAVTGVPVSLLAATRGFIRRAATQTPSAGQTDEYLEYLDDAIGGQSGAAARAADDVVAPTGAVKPGQVASEYPKGRRVGGRGESVRPSDPPAGFRESGAWDLTPENQQLMEAGRPPVGRDGLPVELHHRNQSPLGPLDEMTSTTHNTVPHPQSPSQINRSQFAGERARYWRTRIRILLGQE